MTDDPLAAFRTPGTSAPRRPEDPAAQKHRSVADGELANPWSLQDFFGSLNTVMRLPSRPRRNKGEQGADAKSSLQKLRLPRWVLVSGFVAAVMVLLGRPLMLHAFRENAGADLGRVLGVWKATEGSHAGRTFEVTPGMLVFQTSSSSSGQTTHKIISARVNEAGDSTLFTVSYDLEGKAAEFAFWLVPGPRPVIRFKNQQNVTWAKTPAVAKPAPRS